MGSTPKFKAGDPVWARSEGDNAPSGEYKGIILYQEKGSLCFLHNRFEYRVEIEGVPSPETRPWLICECYLRPRRDDYQQHEPLGSRKDLDKPLLSIDVADLNLSEERIRQLEELAK